MATESQLEQLFRSCDKEGKGYIDLLQFRDLCAEYDIVPGDSDIIFADLDHDGDGKINLRDFAWGFQDFLSAGSSSRRSSVQLGEEAAKQAQSAWTHLIQGVGEDSIYQFLDTSGKKLVDLYHELQNVNGSSRLVTHFEDAVHTLLHDVKKLHDEKSKLEEYFSREKEAHLAHIRHIEEELDEQVAQIEAHAIEQARSKFEAEKRYLEQQMEIKTAELQANLQLCQKYNTVLTLKEEARDDYKYQVAAENMELRIALADTTKNLAHLQSEIAHLRAEYEEKCQILNSQQIDLMKFKEHSAHTHKQLQIMHETNRKLRDTNDELLDKLDFSPSSWSTPLYKSDHTSKEYCQQSNLIQSSSSSSVEEYEETDVTNGRLLDSRHVSHVCSAHDCCRQKENVGPDHLRNNDEFLLSQKQLIKCATHKTMPRPIISTNSSSTLSKKRLIFPEPRIGITCNIPDEEDYGPPDRTYKVVFAGDAAVGKSSFIYRICKGKFANNLGATLGVDFQIKTVRVENKTVALQLWDTAGQERFRSMTKNYFRRADGVFLLYDVTNEKSFKSIRSWLQDIQDVTEHQIPLVLCGNKIDLRPDAKREGVLCIDLLCGEKLAQDNGVTFFETSCKSGINILDAILTLSREMLTNEDIQVKSSSMQVLQIEEKKSCCSGKRQ